MKLIFTKFDNMKLKILNLKKINFLVFIFFMFSDSYLNAQTLIKMVSSSGTSNSGPSNATQTATLYQYNCATSNFTSYNPTVTTSFSLSNQSYTSSTYNGLTFGADHSNNSTTTLSAQPIFNTLNSIGSPTNSMFSAIAGSTNTINVANTYSIRLFVDAYYQYAANQSITARNYYGDLTITFNTPIANPVLHFAGCGGAYLYTLNGANMVHGYFTEFELANSPYTFVKLASNSNLTLDATNTKILNKSTPPEDYDYTRYANSGYYAGSGSLQLNTGNTKITSVTLKVYLKGSPAYTQNSSTNPGAWAGAVSEGRVGDAVNISVSTDPANVVLNVLYTGFTAAKNNNTSTLQFAIAQQSPGSKFFIERSTDGINFAVTDSLNALNNTIFNYTDFKPVTGTTNYYRIKEVDVYGKITLSVIKEVIFSSEQTVSVFPVPAISSHSISVQLSTQYVNKQLVLRLRNTLGQTVLTKVISSAKTIEKIDLPALTSGQYFLEVTGGYNYSLKYNTSISVLN
jgi:hypothetical protein